MTRHDEECHQCSTAAPATAGPETHIIYPVASQFIDEGEVTPESSELLGVPIFVHHVIEYSNQQLNWSHNQ